MTNILDREPQVNKDMLQKKNEQAQNMGDVSDNKKQYKKDIIQ